MNLIINKRKLLFTDFGIRSVGLASALTRRSYNIYLQVLQFFCRPVSVIKRRCLVSEGIDTIFLIQTSHKMVLNIKTDKANKNYVILLSNELIMQIGHDKEFQR